MTHHRFVHRERHCATPRRPLARLAGVPDRDDRRNQATNHRRRRQGASRRRLPREGRSTVRSGRQAPSGRSVHTNAPVLAGVPARCPMGDSCWRLRELTVEDQVPVDRTLRRASQPMPLASCSCSTAAAPRRTGDEVDGRAGGCGAGSAGGHPDGGRLGGAGGRPHHLGVGHPADGSTSNVAPPGVVLRFDHPAIALGAQVLVTGSGGDPRGRVARGLRPWTHGLGEVHLHGDGVGRFLGAGPPSATVMAAAGAGALVLLTAAAAWRVRRGPRGAQPTVAE